MNPRNFAILFCLLSAPFSTSGQIMQESLSGGKRIKTEWILSDLTGKKAEGIRITGTPETVVCKYGNPLVFNGSTDGIFIECMPLAGLEKFTIEAIVNPYSGGNTEQRFFHCGEVSGNRVLLETRSTQTDWYFDAYIKSENQQKTLIDPNLLHPLDQWYHIAFIIDHGKLETYINGNKELESHIDLIPLNSGKTSIGVRQNEQSWFKGAIYKIRISPEALKPKKFMHY